MAIGTAAAIIGSAVLSAGATAITSASAANASNYAADQNAAVSREIYNQTRSDLAPYNAAGQGALSALMVRLGITPMSGAPGSPTRPMQPQVAAAPAVTPAGAQVGGSRPSVIAAQGFGGNVAAKASGGPAGTSPLEPAPAPPVAGDQLAPYGDATPQAAPAAAPATAGGQPDFAAYGAANPDLQAEWSRIQQTGNADGFGNDPNAYYQWHYGQYGQNEGRDLPTSGGQPAPQPAAPVDPNAPPAEYYQETYGARPEAAPAPTFNRQQDVKLQDYGDGPQFTYTTKDIENDAGYQFALREGLDSVNAASAARRNLRSGDAAKSLLARGTGVAHQFDNDFFNRALSSYNANRNAFESNRGFGEDRGRYTQGRQDANFIDDRSYGTNLWNTQQTRSDNVFSEDRGFNANRNDQATANLFNLTSAGQNAAAQAGNAGNVFAQNTINSNNQRASTTANAAIANAANVTNLFGSAANAVGTYYGMRGGGGSGGGASMPRQYPI